LLPILLLLEELPLVKIPLFGMDLSSEVHLVYKENNQKLKKQVMLEKLVLVQIQLLENDVLSTPLVLKKLFQSKLETMY
jgi:hypothetical protein